MHPPIIENFPLLLEETINFFENFIVLSGKFFCIPLYIPQSLVLRAATASRSTTCEHLRIVHTYDRLLYYSRSRGGTELIIVFSVIVVNINGEVHHSLSISSKATKIVSYSV